MSTALELRVTRQVLAGLRPLLALFIAIVAVAFTIVGIGLVLSSDENSAAEIAGAGALRYFPMAIGIMLTPTMMPMYVAQGVTRRQFARSGALITLALAALTALFMCAAYPVEALAYRLGGRTYELGLPHLFDAWNDFALIFIEYLVLTTASIAAGWLIGTMYYRLHWFWATLLIPVCLVPTAAAELLLHTSWFGSGLEETGWTRPPLGLAITLASVAIAVAMAAAYVLTRNVTIKLKS